MKKYFLILTLVLLSLAHLALAGSDRSQAKIPAPTPSTATPVMPETLRDQMDKMILSVADMDIMVNKNKELDYEILQEDAERILEALKHISRLDKNGHFKSHILHVKEPAQNMLKYAKKQDSRAGQYPEQIFNACFKCHAENRPAIFLEPKQK